MKESPTEHKKEAEKQFILLIEDDLDDQELFIESVNALTDDIVIYAEENGKKGLTFLEKLPAGKKPAMILIDYNLPEVNGREVLDGIKELNRFDDVVKIIWSTSNSTVFKQECMESGANQYVVKPHDFAGIQKLAEKLIAMVYQLHD